MTEPVPTSEPDATPASEVDPAVLAGDPDSAAQLEGGDDDLPPLRRPAWWSDADAVVDGQPTALGE